MGKTTLPPTSGMHIKITEEYCAHNYSPLEVVLAEGNGAWVTDVEGKKYLDMLSAYSAVSFGHSNPRLIQAAEKQLKRLTLTSRAFYNDQTGMCAKELAEFCGMEAVLFMNSGAEAIETAVKCARRWGYEKKGVPEDAAEIITFSGNFHGRTTTIISFSSPSSGRKNFGPYTPGFHVVPYGDAECLEAFISPNTVAVLVEPIQGEGGVIMPPQGYLKAVRELCSKHNILMIADEIQTGLCRTGKVFACEHENVVPDMYVLGKSLGGAIVPISAVVSSHKIFEVFTPGTHGSTFGGNPFACAIAREVLKLIREEKPENNSARLGEKLKNSILAMNSKRVAAVRGLGLFVGVDIKKEFGKAKPYCHELLDLGLLCKDTRDQTIRFAPPLIIDESAIDWALDKVQQVLCN